MKKINNILTIRNFPQSNKRNWIIGMVACLSFNYTQTLGDLNNDEYVDILDIVRTVNIILEIPPEPTGYELWASDVNVDNITNILDINIITNNIVYEIPIISNWSFVFPEIEVLKMKIYSNTLFLGTKNEGLWKANTEQELIEWEYIGLSSIELGVGEFHISDIELNMNDPNEIIVTGRNYSPENSSMFKSYNGGHTWYEITLGLSYYNEIDDTTYFHTLEQVEHIENELIALGYSGYFTSINFGTSWEYIELDYFQFLSGGIYSIYQFQKHNVNNTVLWASGMSTYFSPFVIKSDDGGLNWILLFPNELIPYPYYGFTAFHPTNSEIVYIAVLNNDMIGQMIKSNNGGSDWDNGTNTQPIFIHPNGELISSIVIDENNPEHLFCSGGSYLFESFDGGDNWIEIQTPFANSENIRYLLYDAENQQLFLSTLLSGLYVYKNIEE